MSFIVYVFFLKKKKQKQKRKKPPKQNKKRLKEIQIAKQRRIQWHKWRRIYLIETR